MQTKQLSPFGLRMKPDLKRNLKIAAATNDRSLNNEIVHRLSVSIKNEQEVEHDPNA